MKEVYYWSPCLTKVGTYRSTINSAISLAKYSKNLYSVKIIDSCGEWSSEEKTLKKYNVELISLGLNYFKYLPKTGYLRSRLSYMIIFLISFYPLIKLLSEKKPTFLIIHLLTFLPLLLNFFKKDQVKTILRISGFPKLNFFRKTFWKISSDKIHKVTCPSIDLKNQLISKKIFSDSDLIFLPDPIIKVKEFKKVLLNAKKLPSRKYFISVGRLTYQKNFIYLIEEFAEFLKTNLDYDLYIFGEGENKKKLNELIKKKKITDRVFLKGYSKNINFHMKNAEAFILTSLWEDPGFVLVEAAMNNLFIISSNCKNGPTEFLENGRAGILFESNKENALLFSLKSFLKIKSTNAIDDKRKKAKKNCKNYTLVNHYNILNSHVLRF